MNSIEIVPTPFKDDKVVFSAFSDEPPILREYKPQNNMNLNQTRGEIYKIVMESQRDGYVPALWDAYIEVIMKNAATSDGTTSIGADDQVSYDVMPMTAFDQMSANINYLQVENREYQAIGEHMQKMIQAHPAHKYSSDIWTPNTYLTEQKTSGASAVKVLNIISGLSGGNGEVTLTFDAPIHLATGDTITIKSIQAGAVAVGDGIEADDVLTVTDDDSTSTVYTFSCVTAAAIDEDDTFYFGQATLSLNYQAYIADGALNSGFEKRRDRLYNNGNSAGGETTFYVPIPYAFGRQQIANQAARVEFMLHRAHDSQYYHSKTGATSYDLTVYSLTLFVPHYKPRNPIPRVPFTLNFVTPKVQRFILASGEQEFQRTINLSRNYPNRVYFILVKESNDENRNASRFTTTNSGKASDPSTVYLKEYQLMINNMPFPRTPTVVAPYSGIMEEPWQQFRSAGGKSPDNVSTAPCIDFKEFSMVQTIYTIDVGNDPTVYTTKGAGTNTKIDFKLKFNTTTTDNLILYTMVNQQNFYTISGENYENITPQMGSIGFTP